MAAGSRRFRFFFSFIDGFAARWYTHPFDLPRETLTRVQFGALPIRSRRRAVRPGGCFCNIPGRWSRRGQATDDDKKTLRRWRRKSFRDRAAQFTFDTFFASKGRY